MNKSVYRAFQIILVMLSIIYVVGAIDFIIEKFM